MVTRDTIKGDHFSRRTEATGSKGPHPAEDWLGFGMRREAGRRVRDASPAAGLWYSRSALRMLRDVSLLPKPRPLLPQN